jgi:hypothetical protein
VVFQSPGFQLREPLDEELAHFAGAEITDIAEKKRTRRIVDSNRAADVGPGRKAPAAYVA